MTGTLAAASHLESLRRSGKLHALIGHCRDVLQHDRATADEVRRTGQNLHGCDTADACGRKSRVLRPDRVLCPHIRRDRTSGFIAIAVTAHSGTWIHAEVRVHVDETRSDPAIMSIDYLRIGRCLESTTDCLDMSVDDEDVGVVQPLAGARQHRGATDQCRRHLPGVIGRGVRVRRDCNRRGTVGS
jgi:hypothetical protein